MADEAAEPPKEDSRLLYLESWVSLKLPSGSKSGSAAFKKLLATEAAVPINHFLSNPDVRRVFIYGKDKENKELLCGDLPPPTLYSKRRAVYFVKAERKAVPAGEGEIERVVMPGDLLPDALSQMHRLCEAAYLPLLANPDNQGSCTAPVMAVRNPILALALTLALAPALILALTLGPTVARSLASR